MLTGLLSIKKIKFLQTKFNDQKSFAVGSKMAAANDKISATFKSNFKGKKSKEFVQKLIKTNI